MGVSTLKKWGGGGGGHGPPGSDAYDCTWPALLAIGGGCGRGMCPLPPLAFLALKLSISIDFHVF